MASLALLSGAGERSAWEKPNFSPFFIAFHGGSARSEEGAQRDRVNCPLGLAANFGLPSVSAACRESSALPRLSHVLLPVLDVLEPQGAWQRMLQRMLLPPIPLGTAASQHRCSQQRPYLGFCFGNFPFGKEISATCVFSFGVHVSFLPFRAFPGPKQEFNNELCFWGGFAFAFGPSQGAAAFLSIGFAGVQMC